jgi:hypothetical protein
MSNLVQNQGINLVAVNKAGQMFDRFHDNKETYLIGVNANGYDIVIQNPVFGLKENRTYVVEDAFRCPPKNESNS